MMSLKQEKQARTRKKHEKTSKKQEPAFENKKSKTPIQLYEAKRQVFSLIQQGRNYREISQVSFLIEGLGLKRFSISEISKIKNEFLGVSHNDENNSENSKEDKSEIFKLIKIGTNLEDIVISTGQDPEFVKNAYNEYIELQNLSKSLSDEILELLEKKGITVHNPDSLKQVIAKMADSHIFLYRLEYLCSCCKKPVPLSPYRDNRDWAEDLVDAIIYLSKTHGHPEC